MRGIVPLFAPLAAAIGLSGHSTFQAAPEPCAAVPLADTVTPSREAFFREVLFSPATPRTPRFDDYTDGSYHVDKLDLVTGLPITAAACAVLLHAVLVVGPVGPLWAYHIFAFVEQADTVRLNALVMPHARITGKATRTVDRDSLAFWLRRFEDLPLLSRGVPSWPASEERLSGESSFDLFLAHWSSEGGRYFHGTISGAADADTALVRRVLEHVNAFARGVTSTYPITDSEAGRQR